MGEGFGKGSRFLIWLSLDCFNVYFYKQHTAVFIFVKNSVHQFLILKFGHFHSCNFQFLEGCGFFAKVTNIKAFHKLHLRTIKACLDLSFRLLNVGCEQI